MTTSVTSSKSIYHFVMQRTGDGIMVCSSAGIVTYVNPAAAAMLSLRSQQIIGKHAGSTLRAFPAVLKLLNNSGELSRDVRLPFQRLATGTASTLNNGDRVLILHDITEQRDIETRRITLSKTLAHDLRNPISGIRGFVDLVERFGELNADQKRFLERAQQSTDKVQQMLRQLVDLAWIEAGMSLQRESVRLNEIINDELQSLRPLAKMRSLHFVTSIQTPLPVIMGDSERLAQVVHNLLTNAINYSSPDRTIAVHAWGDDYDVFCSVADQGFGIATHEQQLIWDRMYRSSDERVRGVSGGGLGLTIARTIVERHGGSIWLTSRMDEGSTFTFHLPAISDH